MGSELGRLGSYRVGDAERTRTIDLLKEAHVAGYLTLTEIDERLSAALAARTRDDLERLLADLPPEWRARQDGHNPQQPVAPRRAVPPVAWRLLPLVLVVAAVVVLAVVTRGVFFAWPLLWVWFAFGRRHGHSGRRSPDSQRVTWV
jgi:hypothetical protein